MSVLCNSVASYMHWTLRVLINKLIGVIGILVLIVADKMNKLHFLTLFLFHSCEERNTLVLLLVVISCPLLYISYILFLTIGSDVAFYVVNHFGYPFLAFQVEIPQAFVCAESKIFDVSEWAICQVSIRMINNFVAFSFNI